MSPLVSQYLPYMAFGSLVVSIGIGFWAVYIHMRLRTLLRGKTGKDLEGMITDTHAKHAECLASQQEMGEALRYMQTKLADTARGTATVRFNAFKGQGESGAQSFATAFVSERGDGVIISSMHTREQTRVFAKPLSAFASDYELTDEEQQALAQARERL